MSLNRRSFLALAGTAAALPVAALAAPCAAAPSAVTSSALPTAKQLHRGLHLVVGPTASGKTRLVRELAQMVATTTPDHVMVVSQYNESPYRNPAYFEYVAPGKWDDPDDKDGPVMTLRRSMRMSADLIVVDAPWSPNLVKHMCIAADCGYGVIATAHSGSTVEALDMVNAYLQRSDWDAPLDYVELHSVTSLRLHQTRRDSQTSIQRVTNTEWTDRTVRRLVAEGRLHDAHQALARVQQAA